MGQSKILLTPNALLQFTAALPAGVAITGVELSGENVGQLAVTISGDGVPDTAMVTAHMTSRNVVEMTIEAVPDHSGDAQ